MKRRVLVVDDNPTNLKLASDVLETEGYLVDRAGDAEQAQEIIRAREPDLILMDVGLPGMDGLTLTRKLKTDPAKWHIRIIALTAFAMKGDLDRAMEAGCDGYIAKPFDTRLLAIKVEETLRRPRRT